VQDRKSVRELVVEQGARRRRSNTEKRKLCHSTWFPHNGKLDSHVQSQILYMGTVHAANNAYMIYRGEGLWGSGGTMVVEDNIEN
jgi:hypothetical protein